MQFAHIASVCATNSIEAKLYVVWQQPLETPCSQPTALALESFRSVSDNFIQSGQNFPVTSQPVLDPLEQPLTWVRSYIPGTVLGVEPLMGGETVPTALDGACSRVVLVSL